MGRLEIGVRYLPGPQLAMESLCLLDAIEVHQGVSSLMCLMGRTKSGASCAVFLAGCEYTIYMAASPRWSGHATLADELEQHLRRNRWRCTRTLCPCRKCSGCGEHPDNCLCPCRKCKQDECKCESYACVEVNSELCGLALKEDLSPAVLGVEPVWQRGAQVYERDARLFYRVRLARAQFAPQAKAFLYKVNALLPPELAGVYDVIPSAVDSFLALKNAGGYCWLDFPTNHPAARRRTRCELEFHAAYRAVVLSADQSAFPPPQRELCLDIETLAPRMRLSRVDLPAFGAPRRATNPQC